jgi:hypothetical protein
MECWRGKTSEHGQTRSKLACTRQLEVRSSYRLNLTELLLPGAHERRRLGSSRLLSLTGSDLISDEVIRLVVPKYPCSFRSYAPGSSIPMIIQWRQPTRKKTPRNTRKRQSVTLTAHQPTCSLKSLPLARGRIVEQLGYDFLLSQSQIWRSPFTQCSFHFCSPMASPRRTDQFKFGSSSSRSAPAGGCTGGRPFPETSSDLNCIRMAFLTSLFFTRGTTTLFRNLDTIPSIEPHRSSNGIVNLIGDH